MTTTVTVPVEQLENWRNDLSLHGVGGIETAVEIDAMLHAAPAPEGGAVSDAIRAKYDQVKGTAYRAGTPAERMKDGRLQGLNDALAIAMVAEERTALATREEAPVETTEQLAKRLIGEVVAEDEARRKLIGLIEQWAGESEYDAEDMAALADDILHAFNGPPVVREEAPAEAGEDGVRGLISEAIQGLERAIASTRFDSAAKEVFAACVDDFRKVLRAQPQAREEAQPVAWRWRVGDDTPWCPTDREPKSPLLQVQPLYTHPAPDALRDAVEALEKIENPRSDFDLKHSRSVARQALAALQAEQKGGA